MPSLSTPYWYNPDSLPGLDFCRQFVKPGEQNFPDGALALYTDDDFWCVAALPLDHYGDVPLREIVAELWPSYIDQATFAPDHGTNEQELYFARNESSAQKARYDSLWEDYCKLRDDHERLRVSRTDVAQRSPRRIELERTYFVRQYEHLLVAMAHEAIPQSDLPGICHTCGLYISDRVHSKGWITKHNLGYPPDMEMVFTQPPEYED